MLRDLVALGADVVVADVDPGARVAASSAGATAVDEAEALPRVDAAIVATPAMTHAAVADALLPREIPILIEKPFTTSVADAERLVTVAGDRLFVGHTWRYHPGVELLGQIAQSGELGPIAGLRSIRTNWTSSRGDVDSVWNLVPHDLTLAIEILGAIPEPRELATGEDRSVVPLSIQGKIQVRDAHGTPQLSSRKLRWQCLPKRLASRDA